MSTTKAPPKTNGNTTEAILYVAFELSDKSWKLGFTTGHGQKPRERNVTARDQEGILNEIAQAKRRLGLPETAPVVSCYEAGREGFWLHRLLHAHEITNHVVDSSAIEVSRRQRRAKSDGLDVRKLLSMLIRYEQGEHRVWQVVNVPSVEAEDHRHLHRDLETLKRERASTTTRIKGLLSSQGISGEHLDEAARATRRLTALGWLADSTGSAASDFAGLCPSHLFERTDCRDRSRTPCPASDLKRREYRQNPSVNDAQRHWDQWVMVVGDGIFWLARLQESSGSGRLSGFHPHAVSKRREQP